MAKRFYRIEIPAIFNQQRASAVWGATIVLISIAGGCWQNGAEESSAGNAFKQTMAPQLLPAGLPEMHIPYDNPSTVEKIALGKKLFFDPILSADRSIACATCHDPEKGWADGLPVSVGVEGRKGKRNSLSILNSGFYKKLFWDGRAKSLEQQALVPILNPEEMGLESEDEILVRLNEGGEYGRLFDEAFEDGLTVANVGKAIACFERTILLGDTPFDRYEAGDKEALSESAVRGMKLFFNERQANCGTCHAKPLFSDQEFYNLGVGMDQPDPDLGYHVTLGWGFKGAFRSPSLRGITQTAPYMHDGSLQTLEEVVEFYAKGGIPNSNLDVGMRKLRLSDQDKSDLVQFLKEGFRTYSQSD